MSNTNSKNLSRRDFLRKCGQASGLITTGTLAFPRLFSSTLASHNLDLIEVKGDPEKAIQTNIMLMERQLNRIRVQVEEQQATRLQEGLKEYERLGNLGEEISQIARQFGKGPAVGPTGINE